MLGRFDEAHRLVAEAAEQRHDRGIDQEGNLVMAERTRSELAPLAAVR